ncbi:MAG TPA: tetratricopeptide repeat protein [Bryobacteraceae bacterium]|nr:tetratricopeptide repeat protein [Bryobacteraceae bacterium]
MRFGIRAALPAGALLLCFGLVSSLPAQRPAAVTRLARVTVDYPPEGAVLPPEFPSIAFRWRDEASSSVLWRVEILFSDGAPSIIVKAKGDRMRVGEIDPRGIAPLNELPVLTSEEAAGHIWRPDDATWAAIKKHSRDSDATISITGLGGPNAAQATSAGRSVFRTSSDPVGAPVFYRDVPLIPSQSNGQIGIIPKDAMRLINWRLRDLASKQSRIVMTDLPTCANCHSFSGDGKKIGIDVDGPMNDKSLYSVVPLKKQTIINARDVFKWNTPASAAEGRKLRAGFMSQLSPDGRYVLTTLDERDPRALNRAYGLEEKYYFAVYKDYRFGQVFFPTRGILVWRDTETGRTEPLPGADDPEYVHTDGVWSNDGKWIVFARGKAVTAFPKGASPATFANDPHETQLQYSLYRIPFSNGKGGRPEPIEGAADNGFSNNFPKITPDGRWIVYVRCKNGQLMRPDSRLYIVPFDGGESRAMKCNTSLMNSWHSISPNGRWMVFASKARSPYTQLYLTHLNPDGSDSPPILIENTQAANRAANIPEFVNIPADGLAKLEIPASEFYRVFDVAADLISKGQIEESIPQWRKAAELDPEDEKVQVNLGFALDHQGLIDEAIEHYRKAIALAPEHAAAYDNLAQDLIQRGRLDEAIEAWSSGLSIDPMNPKEQANLGTALYQKSRLDEAIVHCEKALELDSSVSDAHNTLGLAYARQGRLDDAVGHFQSAVAANSGSLQYQTNLGRVLAQQGRFQEAIPHMERAAALSNRSEAVVLSLLAAMYAQVGRFQDALESARQALDLANRRGDGELAGTLNLRIARYQAQASQQSR